MTSSRGVLSAVATHNESASRRLAPQRGGFEHIAERLLVGVDALMLALVVVALTQPVGTAWLVWLAAALLGGWYGWGRHRLSVARRPLEASSWWPGQAWALGMQVCFAGLLLTSTGGMWVAFPLMLVELLALGPRRGIAAVVVTTALAILLGATLRGQSQLGFVLGPLVGAGVAVGVVVALEALMRVVAEKNAALDDLSQARERLSVVESERAVATERARLARDIHDTLAQDFSAISLQLRAVEATLPSGSSALTAVRAAQATAADGLADARQFVAELTRGDVPAGLESALARIVERAQVTGGPTTDLVVTGEQRPLPTEVATALVRVAQSALANVVQHASARTAEVHLAYDDGFVVLDVVDDGLGFDPATPVVSGGFGLAAMRARAEELGGTLTVESDLGDGTAVSLSLPLPEVAR